MSANLDEIREATTSVIIYGREVAVHQLDIGCGDIYSALPGTDLVTHSAELRKVVRRCMPDLTEDEIGRLTYPQVQAINKVAGEFTQQQVEIVAGRAPANPVRMLTLHS